jgi:hypothetical protein
MRRELFEDPPLARAVFASTLFAWVALDAEPAIRNAGR